MGIRISVSRFLSVFILACSITTASAVRAQSGKFATAGSLELGGNVSYQSNSDAIGSTNSLFTLQPFFGWFPSECFELGFDPFGIMSQSDNDITITQYTLFVAPAYNFRTSSSIYPFIEADLGYTSESISGGINGSPITGSNFSYGARGGIKIAITPSALLNVGLQYLHLNYFENPNGAYNDIAFSSGFTVVL